MRSYLIWEPHPHPHPRAGQPESRSQQGRLFPLPIRLPTALNQGKRIFPPIPLYRTRVILSKINPGEAADDAAINQGIVPQGPHQFCIAFTRVENGSTAPISQRNFSFLVCFPMGLHSQSLNSTTAAPSLPSFPSEFTLGLIALRPVGGGKGSLGTFPTFPDSGIVPLLSGKARGAGFTARDNRLFLEAVFRGVGAGALWLDLSPCFGQWNSQFRPFRGWATSGVFEYLFKALSGNAVRSHQRRHCPGSPEGLWPERGTHH